MMSGIFKSLITACALINMLWIIVVVMIIDGPSRNDKIEILSVEHPSALHYTASQPLSYIPDKLSEYQRTADYGICEPS